MPGLGEGIARGADAFVQNFMQAKRMEHEEKLQKNMNIVKILQGQLEDENLSYDQRAKILDTIPQLLGVDKQMGRPLSQMMGLDKFNEKQVADPNKPAATPNSTQVDPNAVDKTITSGDPSATDGSLSTSSPMASSINTKGTQAQLIRQGDTTPAQIKTQLVRAQKKAEEDGNVDRAEKIAQFNFELQEKSYKANGYKVTSEGTDAQGQYVQVLTNNSGDIKVNRMPEGYKPLKLQVAEANINKPSMFVKEREDYWESQGLSPEDAAKKALEDTNDKYNLKKKTGEAYITSLTDKNTGTTPPTPEQVRNNAAQKQKQLVDLQNNRDNIKAQSISASAEAKSMADQLHAKWVNEVEPIKKQWDAISSTYDVTDQNQKAIKQEYDKKTAEYNNLKIKADEAVNKDKGLQGHLADVENNLRNFGSSTPSVTPRRILNSQQQETIKKIRAKNPAQTKNMSDDDIINLVAKPK